MKIHLVSFATAVFFVVVGSITVFSQEAGKKRPSVVKESVGLKVDVDALPEDLVQQLKVKKLPGWRMTHAGERIRKDWVVKDFAAGLEFFDRVGQVAEEEFHHPDLHLEGFRNVWIELSTHAIGGLSDNDFILAAKIDKLPIKRKTAR